MKHNLIPPHQEADFKQVMVTVLICTALLFVWQYLYVMPNRVAREAEMAQQLKAEQEKRAQEVVSGEVQVPLSREEAIHATKRIRIESPALRGSLNLQGLRLDDLELLRHRIEVAKDSPNVVLLSPPETESRYFIQLGWLAGGQGQEGLVPDARTLWQADGDVLRPGKPLVLTWANPQNVLFRVTLNLDENYLVTVRQEVVNQGVSAIRVVPYGLINRATPKDDQFSTVLHNGAIGVLDNQTLEEQTYGTLKKDGNQRFESARGWVGVVDKYWLSALIPDKNSAFQASFQHITDPNTKQERTQVDYMAPLQDVATGASASYGLHVFAGAKELNMLDHYRDSLAIPLFDRAVDFGVLYFLTRPIFLILDYFFHLLGNFGLAILLFVVLLKIVTYPLSDKSYRSLAKMQMVQPEMERIRKEFEHDKLKMQQEVMAVWKKEKVNPASGCVPLLLQLPIFFALYKVLLVSIEMRHAPFYGWIHDLSAADPTNIFNLFGLIPWDPPSMLHIGLWPIIMSITMIIQQRFNPKPKDWAQAKMMQLLPYLFLVLFASFPAGLLIYWAWNNLLGILQQWIIKRSFERHKKRKSAALEFVDSKP